jgi:1-acyl-sn-glycerol-3-phosphate acyltransferase
MPRCAIPPISVGFLTSLGCIPVTRGHTQELTISVEVLKEGKVVLIFPEDPEMDMDPVTQMRPFLKGFTRLGEMYYAETGEALRFYPVAVHGSRRVQVGQPMPFDPENPLGAERLRLMHVLEDKIREMYLEMGG